MIESHIVVIAEAPPRTQPGIGAHREGALAGVAGTWVSLTGDSGFVDEFDLPVLSTSIDATVLGQRQRFVEETLRPLCSDGAVDAAFDEPSWRAFSEAAATIAKVAAGSVDPSGLTVVVGEALGMVPKVLRDHRPNARMAMLFDAAFPPVEIFARLPWRREFLEGVLSADVVMVHSERSARNLEAAAARFADVVVGDGVLATPDRRVRLVVSRPAVDAGFVAELAASPQVVDAAALVRETVGGKRRVMVVTDLRSPTAPTSTLQRRVLEELVSRHPDLLGDLGVIHLVLDGDGSASLTPLEDWPVPAFRIEGPMAMEDRAPLLVAADVVVSIGAFDDLSPLPKEFVATRVGGTGALVVAELTTAAEDLDGAFVVNPWDAGSTADAIAESLTAPDALLRARMDVMRSQVLAHDTGAWVETMVAALAEVRTSGERRPWLPAVDSIEMDLRRLRHRLSSGGLVDAVAGFDEIATLLRDRSPILFLDFDGTLSPIVSHPNDAALPSRERQLVTALADVIPVAIVSGRDLDDVRAKVDIGGIWYAGSHGFDIADPSGVRPEDGPANEFQHFVEQLDEAETGLRRRLDGADPGVVIERKRFTIAVHYRQAPHERLSVVAAVEEMAEKRSWLRVTAGKAVVELRPAVDWDKGAAVRWLIARLGDGNELPVYIGDDLTDEPAFRTVRDGGVGVFVGRGRHGTGARYRLDTRDQVPEFLERLLRTLTV